MYSVSVIMGVYKPDRLMLERAIDSVLNQSLQPLELIICDDDSRDGTYEFLIQKAKIEKRLRILNHDENKGLAAALNACIKIARGECIARQDADDYSAPERFRKQISYLEAHPECAVVGSAIHMYNENGVWATKSFKQDPCKRDFLFAIPFSHGSLVFRKECLLRYLYRSIKRTRRTEDYELLMRLYAGGHIGANLQEPLYYYREDKESLIRRKYRYRIDEAIVRTEGFYRLGILFFGITYIIKPLIVGLIPGSILMRMKKRYYRL